MKFHISTNFIPKSHNKTIKVKNFYSFLMKF